MGSLMRDYSNLIVDDEYWNDMAVCIKSRCDGLEELYIEYVGILEDMANNAITEGKTHETIEEFILIANELKEQFGLIGLHVKNLIENYLTDVDKADKYLY